MKLVVTNAGLLERKYGASAAKVWKALEKLQRADRRRSLATRIVRLDVAEDMAAFKAPRLEKGRDPRKVKEAVDRVFEAVRPDYLLLLGAQDVLPQQPLAPTLDDQDKVVPSDLPYACKAGPSRQPHDFTGPTRVVGRLPGAVGEEHPDLLITAIETATSWEPRARSEYSRPFAITTDIWKTSTELSLNKVFGDTEGLQLVPPQSDRWPKELLGRLAHYINCHGISGEPVFEGQDGKKYPAALTGSYVAHRLAPGTVAAVECCYGGQLYDAEGSEPRISMANTYLHYGAYAYFGSSTSTYAPGNSNDSADLMCQGFLRYVLDGASTGRATLEARHDYLHSHLTLDGSDLKTLAQFTLMGDPSVHPVVGAAATWSNGAGTKDVHTLLALRRGERRLGLAARGEALHEASSVPGRLRKLAVPPKVQGVFRKAAREHGGKMLATTSSRVQPRAHGRRLRQELGLGTPTIHMCRVERGRDARGNPHTMLVIAHELDGEVTAVRKLFSH